MGKNYKIKVQIEIVESTEEIQDEPQEVGAGQFELVLDEKQALSIDDCEQALLRTNYPAVRAALAAHLSAMSKKKATVAGHAGEVQTRTYRVDGEVGRFMFETHRVEREDGAVVDTRELFPRLTGQEWYRTVGFKELGIVQGTLTGSYRRSTAWLNRLRHQAPGTPTRTLSHNSEQEGLGLLAHLEQQTADILAAHEFSDDHPAPAQQAHYQQQAWVTHPAEQVQAAVLQCAPDASYLEEMAHNPVPYEVAAQSVQVSIDPVGVKHQKETHNQVPKEQPRDMVYQTVAHLQHGEREYLFNGREIAAVLRCILAFLLHNDLLRYNLLFFVDGQRSLSQTILALFAWFTPLQLILDWPHLVKKCREQLSMALKGREIRNQVLKQLVPLLWLGCVDRAIQLLQQLDPAQIKNSQPLEQLMGYFQRQQPFIPCYAVRKTLGLRNSSNRGEKANDLLVAHRQKHKGMSWSDSGSVALAALAALVRNDEQAQWFRAHSLRFAFAS